jgi:WD40 repeat protein
MRRSWQLVVLFCLAVGCSSAAAADKRVALVIGNAVYAHAPKLSNTLNDAAILARTFRDAGFAVVDVAQNLPATEMKRALRDFAGKVRDAEMAVVYYAGHGIEVDGADYLVPVDARLENDSDVLDETISLERVLVAIQPARRLRLVILDACRDNPLAKTMNRALASRAMGRGLAKVEPANPNTMVAFAAKAGSTALDGVGDNSPFATALAKHIATPGIDLRKAFGYVRDDVLKATDYKQEPFIYGSLGGDDVVLGPPAVAAPANPAPLSVADPNATLRLDYEYAERLGTREGWDVFVATHPAAGYLTELAKAQRNKLAAGTAPVSDSASAKPDADKTSKDKRVVATAPAPEIVKPAPQPPPVLGSAPVSPAPNRPAETELATGSVCGAPGGRDGAAVGGPFMPVSIRPSLDGAEMMRAVAVSPTGNEIATAGDDGVIRLWDAHSFLLTRVLKAHAGPVYAIDYWADGRQLASAGWDGKVMVWDLPRGEPAYVFDAPPAGEFRSGSVRQFGVAFYPQAPLKYLATAGEDGYVRIWDWQKRQVAAVRLDHRDTDPSRTPVRSLSYAPNGSGEFVTAGFDGRIRIWRPNGTVDTLEAFSRKALRVAYSPDGSRVASAGSNFGGHDPASVKLWDVRRLTYIPLIGHEDYAVSAAWSPDGSKIVTGGGGKDRSVRLWDARSGRLLASFAGHTADVEAVAFYPGGTRLISVSEDKTIKLWDIAAQKEMLSAAGFAGRDFLVYSPEGCYAGSSGIDSRVSVLTGSRYERISADARKAMFNPAGFAGLLGR